MSKGLEIRVSHALGILMPKFSVTSDEAKRFKRPSFEISLEDDVKSGFSGASYNPAKNALIFHPSMVDDPLVIGEEVSHYIHHQLNPLTFTNPFRSNNLKFKEMKRYWDIRNFEEAVGRYGSLIYIKERGLSFKRSKDFLKKSEAYHRGLDLTDPIQSEIAHSYLEHSTGYQRADYLFENFGASLLPTLARISIDEALEMLPRVAPISFFEKKIIPLIDGVMRRENSFEMMPIKSSS